jgi:hypothetical protein
MAGPETVQPRLRQDPEKIATPLKEHDCAESVLRAYTAAIGRAPNGRDAYDAAVRTYLLYHPNLLEEAARLAVARIISSKE